MQFQWRLRELMALRGMHQTTQLHAALKDRGFDLPRAQVYRIVNNMPERLNLELMANVCDLQCSLNDVLGADEGGRLEPPQLARDQTPAGSTLLYVRRNDNDY